MENSSNSLIGKHVLIEIIVDYDATTVEVEGMIISYDKLGNDTLYIISPVNNTKCFPHGFPRVSRCLQNILEIWEP